MWEKVEVRIGLTKQEDKLRARNRGFGIIIHAIVTYLRLFYDNIDKGRPM